MKSLSLKFKRQISEVFIIKPNDLGNNLLNFLFKRSTTLLKKFPFIFLLPISFFITFIIYLLLGSEIIIINNILQYGF